LINNAVKFSETGPVTLEIDSLPACADQVILRFTVRDQGIGMSMAEAASLFRPFVQVDASMTRRFGGTGLGLAISKQLVDLMGGEIGVDSHPGQGSAFHFTARFRRPTSADLASTAISYDLAPEQQDRDVFDRIRGLRVLLVEDNSINQMLALELLGSIASTEVTLATNGQEALDLLDQIAFDIVLMDIQMPVMDGITATRRIRQQSRFQQLPIIAMTAHAMLQDREESLAAGMNDHINKPFEPAELFAMLAKWTQQPALQVTD
jgi:CheY-like chemotaxis protein